MAIGTPPDSGFSWDGFYRAKVIDNRDTEFRGRVKIWVPDLMPEVDDSKGIWARPANNPLGGRNTEENSTDQYYQGTCYIPLLGSYVFVFFENGNPNQPYYFCSGEFGQTKVPVECQVGGQYWNKWLVFKSRKGHTIIISDDPDDERTEITGKKRSLSSSDASGNANSIFSIQGNQSVILIDDRSGQEKILIKDFKGNFIHLNTAQGTLDVQITGDLKIKATGTVYITGQEGIELKTNKNLNAQAQEKINIKSEFDLNMQSVNGMVNGKAGTMLNMEATAAMNLKAGANMIQQAATILAQTGSAAPAADAGDSIEAAPVGDRQDPSSSVQSVSDPEKPIRQTIPPTIRNNQKPPELST